MAPRHFCGVVEVRALFMGRFYEHLAKATSSEPIVFASGCMALLERRSLAQSNGRFRSMSRLALRRSTYSNIRLPA